MGPARQMEFPVGSATMTFWRSGKHQSLGGWLARFLELLRIHLHALFFFGIVVSLVSIGHVTSLRSSQKGHVTACGTSRALLYGPETVNVFLHLVQVMIFSIAARNSASRERSGTVVCGIARSSVRDCQFK